MGELYKEYLGVGRFPMMTTGCLERSLVGRLNSAAARLTLWAMPTVPDAPTIYGAEFDVYGGVVAHEDLRRHRLYEKKTHQCSHLLEPAEVVKRLRHL